MSRGSVSYEVSADTTEWEDILIKKNILTWDEVMINKGLNPDEVLERENESVQFSLLQQNDDSVIKKDCSGDMDELEDGDLDEEFILEYRKRRLEEIKRMSVQNRFGDVREINKDDWIAEVTECSNNCWVIVHLYQDSVEDCSLLNEWWNVLAPKYRYVKFLRIKSTKAVENWPDKNLPTLFLYHGGALRHQLITLRSLDGRTVDDLEIWLAHKNVIETDIDIESNKERKSHTVNKVVGRTRHEGMDFAEDDY